MIMKQGLKYECCIETTFAPSSSSRSSPHSHSDHNMRSQLRCQGGDARAPLATARSRHHIPPSPPHMSRHRPLGLCHLTVSQVWILNLHKTLPSLQFVNIVFKLQRKRLAQCALYVKQFKILISAIINGDDVKCPVIFNVHYVSGAASVMVATIPSLPMLVHWAGQGSHQHHSNLQPRAAGAAWD